MNKSSLEAMKERKIVKQILFHNEEKNDTINDRKILSKINSPPSPENRGKLRNKYQ